MNKGGQWQLAGTAAELYGALGRVTGLDLNAGMLAVARSQPAPPGAAITWLERAKHAARYEPRHYPYFNLARVYVRQHKVHEAIRELQQAVAIEPRYTVARRELHRLLGLLN